MTTRAKAHAKPHAKHEHHEPHPAPPVHPEALAPHVAPEVDVLGVIEHILDALGHLARQAGSPPEALTALAAAREQLGKE